jgi:hypothetical protein
MQPDKKQTIQLVVLGLLVVVFVGYLSFEFLAPKGQATPPDSTSGNAGDCKSAKSVRASDEETAEPDQVAIGVFPDLTSVPSRRDPFMPQKLGDLEVAESIAIQQRSQYRPKLPTFAKNLFSKVPAITVPPVNPFAQNTRVEVPSRSTAIAQPEDNPEFVLTGVVRGEENVAIIRSRENGRYVVKQGQFIDGRYKVLYVTPDGVVLADGHRRIHVKLGGVKNAS